MYHKQNPSFFFSENPDLLTILVCTFFFFNVPFMQMIATVLHFCVEERNWVGSWGRGGGKNVAESRPGLLLLD
jgi:hypothetical protein